MSILVDSQVSIVIAAMSTSNAGNCNSPATNYPDVTNCPPTCVPVSYFPNNAALTSVFNGQALPQALTEISTDTILWSSTGAATCLPTNITNLTGWLTWVEANVVADYCNGSFVTCESVKTALENNGTSCILDSNSLTDIIGFTGNGTLAKIPPGTQGDFLRISTINGALQWEALTCNTIKSILENNGNSCVEDGNPSTLWGLTTTGTLTQLPPGNNGEYLCINANGLPEWSTLAGTIDCGTLTALLQPIGAGGNCISQIVGSHPIILGYNPTSGTVQWGDAYNLPDPTAANQLFISTGGGAEQNNSQWLSAPTAAGQYLCYDGTDVTWQGINTTSTCAEIVSILENNGNSCIPQGAIRNIVGFSTNGQLMQLPPANIGDVLTVNQFGEPQYLTLTCAEIVQRIQDGQCILPGQPTQLIGFADNGVLESLAPNNESDILTIANGIPTWQQITCDQIRNAIQTQPTCVPTTTVLDDIFGFSDNEWDRLQLGNVGEVLTITNNGIEWQAATAATVNCAAVVAALDGGCLTNTAAPVNLIVHEADATTHTFPPGTAGQLLTVQANGTINWQDAPIPDCAAIVTALENGGNTCVPVGNPFNLMGFDTGGNLETIAGGAAGQFLVMNAAGNAVEWQDFGCQQILTQLETGCITATTTPANFLVSEADGTIHSFDWSCQTIRDLIENNNASCVEDTTILANIFGLDATGNWDKLTQGTVGQILTVTANGIEWQNAATVDCAAVVAALDGGCLTDTAAPVNLIVHEADATTHTFPPGTAGQLLTVQANGTINWQTLDCATVLAALENGGATCIPEQPDGSTISHIITLDADGNIERVPDCNWILHALRRTAGGGCVPQAPVDEEPNTILGLNAAGDPEYFCYSEEQFLFTGQFSPVTTVNVTQGQRIPAGSTQTALVDTDGSTTFDAASGALIVGRNGVYCYNGAPQINLLTANVVDGTIAVNAGIVIQNNAGVNIQEYRLYENSYAIDTVAANPPNGASFTMSGSICVQLTAGQRILPRVWFTAINNTGGSVAEIRQNVNATTFWTVTSPTYNGADIVGDNC